MTRPRASLSLARVTSHALATALVLGVVDAVVARSQRLPVSWTREVQLEALRGTVLVLLAVYLAARAAIAVLSLRSPLNSRAVSGALALGLLAALLHVDFVSWDAAREDLWQLDGSLAVGGLIGLVSYPLLARLLGGADRGGHSRILLSAGVLGLAAVVAAPNLGSGPPVRAERPVSSGHRVPRVLFIVADTLRADALSGVSDTAPPTPVLDELAQSGFRFDQARSPSPWTLPAVASTMTGLSPLVHGAVTRESSLPPEIPTLAERLADVGYRTAAIGHNFVLSKARRVHQGFDHYDFGARENIPARSLGFLLMAATRPPLDTDVEAAEINQRAFAWLDEHGDEDFFLWLHYYDPHIVYEPPPDLRPAGPPPAGLAHDFGHEGIARVRSGYDVFQSDARRWVRELYDGEVRYLDRELGNLFDELRRRGPVRGHPDRLHERSR